MQIVTPKQMINTENRCEKLGVSKRELMINAGRQTARLIMRHCSEKNFDSPEKISVVFLAGSGNNGGDCFVSADILARAGYGVTVVNLCGKPSTSLSEEMFGHLENTGVKIVTGYRQEKIQAVLEAMEIDFMTVPTSEAEKPVTDPSTKEMLKRENERVSAIRQAVSKADILVDGVFGTGFHGQLEKDMADIFAISTNAYKIAVDVPSGGSCETGTVSDGTFKADETITFGFMKTGMTQYPLKKYCGKITVADIGIPKNALANSEDGREYFLIDSDDLKNFPKKREEDSHKGDFGRVLVIAGSSQMRGAGVFAVLGALRAGAGLVKLASVEKCIDTVSVLAPEATFLEMDCDYDGFMLFDDNKNRLLKELRRADAVVIGCGMGVTNDTVALTKFVLQNAKGTVIVDADGINCIASDIDILLSKGTDVIITPHAGEMARLLNCEPSVVSSNRITFAGKYAERFEITVVLKGAGTVIADGKKIFVNQTGNSGMSKGGSGDVLAGIIGTLSAQGYGNAKSACIGAYLHGLAGDICAEKFGMYSMLPSELISCIPETFGKIGEC